MLTREQRYWMVQGFCDSYEGCGIKCPIRHLCNQVDVNYGAFADDVIDDCFKIIAPELVEEPKPAATPQWISVNDKLPDGFKPVIVCALRIEQGYWDVNGWWMIYVARVKRVTHWMPFPEPPKE